MLENNKYIQGWLSERDERRSEWALQNGVGRYHSDKTFDNYDGDVAVLKQWVEKPENSLLIRSENSGNGKTHLAVACVQGFTDVFVSKNHFTPLVLFVSFTKLLLAIRSTYESNKGLISDADIILTLGDIDLLVVDDFGAEKCSEFVLSTLYAIFNSRYENALPTIFTTNLHGHEVEHNYTPRIWSRMKDGVVFDVSGIDRRGFGYGHSHFYEPMMTFRVLERIKHMNKLLLERRNFMLSPNENKIDGIMVEFI